LEHWPSLFLFFQKAALGDDLPAARTIFNALQNDIFKLYLQFLEFNLKLITDLNQELQSESPKMSLLLNRITSLYKSILKCFVKHDVIKNHEIANINVKDPSIYRSVDNIHFGGKVDAYLKNPENEFKIAAADLHNFKLRCLDFYVELCVQIKKRFNFQDKILLYASLFTPSVVRSGNIFSISEFQNLAVDVDEVNREWQLLSDIDLLTNCDDLSDFWTKVATMKNQIGEPMFNNLMTVVKLILSLPHSSAVAERVFSQLSMIKNRLRNRLAITTCSYILALKENIKTGLQLPPKNYKISHVTKRPIGDAV
jgi:hypothetical protein